mmetsp:Transcript_32722/g.101276  ORF Transcript_32722/g.101276 Transcript_32722/m.101276 type:complete len:101 (-) Transcript_32722:1582-1884(-)
MTLHERVKRSFNRHIIIPIRLVASQLTHTLINKARHENSRIHIFLSVLVKRLSTAASAVAVLRMCKIRPFGHALSQANKGKSASTAKMLRKVKSLACSKT